MLRINVFMIALVIWTYVFTACNDAQGADRIEAGLLLGSYHLDRTDDLNERNYGVYAIVNNVFMLGYKNSYDDFTAAVGYKHDLARYDRVTLGLNYMVIHGYGWHDGKPDDADEYGHNLLLAVVPTASYQLTDRVKLNGYFFFATVAIGIGVEF